MTIPMETSPSAIISSPIEDDFEKELIAELVDNFYKSSRRCLSLILKNLKTPFESLKLILSQAIERIVTLEEPPRSLSWSRWLVRDVDKRHRLNQVDLTLLIEEELNRLTEKVQKTYLETS